MFTPASCRRSHADRRLRVASLPQGSRRGIRLLPRRTAADSGAFREGFQFLDKLLEKLHLQDLDGADLMLLLLLFLLFEEKADDELLIALGLLLIL